MCSKMLETRYYEGCGREGPIRCIFLAEFHPVAGPKVACQFPEDYVSKELFDAISGYIIPKPKIKNCTMTINAMGSKVIGYPIKIDSARYERNAYLFNLCFVCDSWSKTVQYEPVVKKLGEHLTLLEEETGFVSSSSSRLPQLLAHLMHDLNTNGKATIVEGDTVMHLKVVEVLADPPPVHDHDVPVLVCSVGLPCPGRPLRERAPPKSGGGAAKPGPSTPPLRASQDHLHPLENAPYLVDFNADWDLTTHQILPYIDGYNHVAKIAVDTNVDKTLVKSCIQNLVYYGVVVLLPVMKFSNSYRATPKLSRLFRDKQLQRACITFITSDLDVKDGPTLTDVYAVLCSLQQGTNLRAVCELHTSSHASVVNVRRLIVFSLLHQLIRCVKRYPVYIKPERPSRGNALARADPPGVRSLFTGRHCTDEICCLARVDSATLDRIIEDDPNVSIIWR